MKEIHHLHTGLNLSASIMDVLRAYDISLSQIYTLTVDNGRNIVRAGAILNDQAHAEQNIGDEPLDDWELVDESIDVELCNDAITTLRCACHTLQLAVKDFIKEIGEFLPKVREVAKKLRTPTIHNIMKVQKLPKAILDCPTRWSSTFLMCQQMLLFKNFCQDSSTDIKELYLSPSYWTMLDDIVQTLGPIHEVTLKLQKEDLTSSEFYFAWYSCRKKIEKQSGRYSNILLKYLKTRGQSILYKEPILASVYLDPRYQILLTSDQKEVAKVHLKRLLKRKYDYENVSLDSSSPSTCSISSSVSDDAEMLLKQLDNNKDSFSLPPSIDVHSRASGLY